MYTNTKKSNQLKIKNVYTKKFKNISMKVKPVY